MRKPFFRKSHNCWYYKDKAGRFVRLSPDETEAWGIWKRLSACTELTHDPTFRAIAEAFLDANSHLPRAQYDRIVRACWGFSEHVGDVRCSLLTPSMLNHWCSAEKSYGKRKYIWSKSTQRDSAKAVMRVFAWARQKEYISINPMAGLRVEEPNPRDTLMPDETHASLVRHCMQRKESRPFALYLIASRCGARPQQIREVRRENVTTDCRAWVFSDHKTRHKTGAPLVVYLHPCLSTLTRILMANRSGNLFLNHKGAPWKKDTVCQRMRRLAKVAGCRVIAYSYRHSFATNALLAGNSLATVAALLGHTDTRMVGKVYGHLDKHREHLLEAAKIAIRRGQAE